MPSASPPWLKVPLLLSAHSAGLLGHVGEAAADSEPAAAAATSNSAAVAMVVVSPQCPGDDGDVAVECQEIFNCRFAHRASYFLIQV